MRIEYYANGRNRRVTVRGLLGTPQPTERPSAVMRALPAGPMTAGMLFSACEAEAVQIVPVEPAAPVVIPTETMSIGGVQPPSNTRLESFMLGLLPRRLLEPRPPLRLGSEEGHGRGLGIGEIGSQNGDADFPLVEAP
jgi:hypothetical protein